MTELRCRGKLYGILAAERIEVKCRAPWCGAKPGVVVLHYFDIHTGELIDTKQFRDPK